MAAITILHGLGIPSKLPSTIFSVDGLQGNIRFEYDAGTGLPVIQGVTRQPSGFFVFDAPGSVFDADSYLETLLHIDNICDHLQPLALNLRLAALIRRTDFGVAKVRSLPKDKTQQAAGRSFHIANVTATANHWTNN